MPSYYAYIESDKSNVSTRYKKTGPYNTLEEMDAAVSLELNNTYGEGMWRKNSTQWVHTGAISAGYSLAFFEIEYSEDELKQQRITFLRNEIPRLQSELDDLLSQV